MYKILVEARKLISDPKHWTQGHWARSRFGNPIGPEAEGAVCWCASGAIQKVANLDRTKATYWHFIFELDKQTPNGNIISFNDTHTHAEVLAIFDKAIEANENRTSYQGY